MRDSFFLLVGGDGTKQKFLLAGKNSKILVQKIVFADICPVETDVLSVFFPSASFIFFYSAGSLRVVYL